MRDEFIRFRNYKNRVALRFRVRCVSALIRVSRVGPCLMFLSDEGPTLETLDFAFYVGSTPTFLYLDL